MNEKQKKQHSVRSNYWWLRYELAVVISLFAQAFRSSGSIISTPGRLSHPYHTKPSRTWVPMPWALRLQQPNSRLARPPRPNSQQSHSHQVSLLQPLCQSVSMNKVRSVNAVARLLMPKKEVKPYSKSNKTKTANDVSWSVKRSHAWSVRTKEHICTTWPARTCSSRHMHCGAQSRKRYYPRAILLYAKLAGLELRLTKSIVLLAISSYPRQYSSNVRNVRVLLKIFVSIALMDAKE